MLNVTALYMDFNLWANIAVIDSYFFSLSKMALIDACVSVYLGWQKFSCKKEVLGPVFSVNHLPKCPGSSPPSFKLFEQTLVQMLYSAIHRIIKTIIQWISIMETSCIIHYIKINPVDGAIHLLDNLGQSLTVLASCCYL